MLLLITSASVKIFSGTQIYCLRCAKTKHACQGKFPSKGRRQSVQVILTHLSKWRACSFHRFWGEVLRAGFCSNYSQRPEDSGIHRSCKGDFRAHSSLSPFFLSAYQFRGITSFCSLNVYPSNSASLARGKNRREIKTIMFVMLVMVSANSQGGLSWEDLPALPLGRGSPLLLSR